MDLFRQCKLENVLAPTQKLEFPSVIEEDYELVDVAEDG